MGMNGRTAFTLHVDYWVQTTKGPQLSMLSRQRLVDSSYMHWECLKGQNWPCTCSC